MRRNGRKQTDSDNNPFSEAETDDPELTSDLDSVGTDQNRDFSIKSLDDLEISEIDEHKGPRALPHLSLPELNKDEMETFFQHPLVKTAFEGGVNLKDHRNKIYEELFETEKQSLEAYQTHQATIITLSSDLNKCETILTNLTSMLDGFEISLSTRLNEIDVMQREANKKIIKQENHLRISEELTKFINEIYLPDNLTRAIARGKINAAYVQYLEAFDSKISFLEGLVDRDVLAVKEQKQVVRDLVARATDKIKEWLLSKTSTKMKSLATLIKRQKPLLKYTSCFAFLNRFNRVAAKEVASQYVEIASKLYFSHFSSTIDSLSKIQIDAATKDDLLGEPELTGSTWSFFSPKVAPLKKRPVFSITLRQDTISHLNEPIILPLPTTEPTATRYSYEFLFRALNYSILNSIKEEHSFCKQFFSADFTGQIFGKSINLFTNNLKSFCSTNFDAIGLMIIQCVLHEYKEIVSTVPEPQLNEYFTGAAKMLQSQFNTIFEQHRTSLEVVDVSDLGELNCQAAHYITRRYAEFLSAILYLLKIFPEALKGWHPEKHLLSLRTSFQELLKKLADTFKDEQKKLFLINNYDVITCVAQERDVSSPETQHVESQLTTLATEYAQVQLQKYFPKLIKFINQWTVVDPQNRKRKMKDNANCPAKTVEEALKSFTENDYWKKSVETINNETLKSFSNFSRGILVFQEFLGTLSMHFSDLLEIVKSDFKLLVDSPFYISPPVFKTKVAAAATGCNILLN